MPATYGPTRVVTFYSYKGGVGRTMALVNTAAALAQQGLRVLLVDFDLEAPGMTHFFAREVRRRPKQVHKDSLDLLLDAKRSLAEADEQAMEPAYPRSLAEYVIPLPLPKAWVEKSPQGIPYRNGRMDLIPATLEPRRSPENPEERKPPDYLERLQELDLGSLFLPGGPGHRFGDHVRSYFCGARFEAPGDILFALRDSVQAAYDLVLIDSRTGLNEVAGFSIGTVTDALVICCGLNQQNIAGTRYFMKKTGLFDRERAKPFLVALGPVPPWQTAEVERRRQVLRKALHLRQDTEDSLDDLLDKPDIAEEGSIETAYDYPELVEIPYHPLAALAETIFVIQFPSDPMAQAYKTLAARLRSRLEPGALEHFQWQGSFFNLIRNPGPAAWEGYSRFLADRLLRLRLTNSRRLAAPTFPTACGLQALTETRSHVDWDDFWRIPPAAAIAAGRTRSAAPFERVWDLLPLLPGELQRSLARGLICFQSATPHPLPQDVLHWLHLESERERQSDFRLLSDLNAHLASLRLASPQPALRRAIEEALLMMHPWRVLLASVWRWSAEDGSTRSAPEMLQAVEHWVSGDLTQASESLRFLRGHYRLPAEPLEILRGNVPVAKLGSPVLEMASDPTLLSRIPFGFWPEPLAATAAALEGGAEAMDEILAWLHLARLLYGYTWRVLVDWRYFEKVRQHPRFQLFLQEEDDLVDAIEGSIDRGEIPL